MNATFDTPSPSTSTISVYEYALETLNTPRVVSVDLNENTIGQNVGLEDDTSESLSLDLQSLQGDASSGVDPKTYSIRCPPTSKLPFCAWLDRKRESDRKKMEDRKRLEQLKQEQHELKQQVSEQKISEWLYRKNNSAQIKQQQQQQTLSNESNLTCRTKKTKRAKQIKGDTFHDWMDKKQEQAALELEKQKRKQLLKLSLETPRKPSAITYREWMNSESSKRKPVPLNQGLLSLRGSISDMYINPKPWVSNIDVSQGLTP